MPCSPNGRYSAAGLEKILRQVVSEQCQQRGCSSQTCSHDLIYRDTRDERSYKTYVYPWAEVITC